VKKKKNAKKMSCSICAHGDAALVVGRCERWVLRHHGNTAAKPAPRLGWLVLETERHVDGASAFDDAEAAEFGGVLRRATRIVKQLAGCERVYVVAFAEAHPHFHAHLVPRHAADADTKAWAVADLYRRVLAHEVDAHVSPDDVARFVERARQLW
jgi:diadenosine tetraphosphate (Ap4A) HIT family hydrolase